MTISVRVLNRFIIPGCKFYSSNF